MASNVYGVPGLNMALDALVAATTAAAMVIIKRSELVLEANIKKQFTGSHKRGEPTTSSPGEPPDVVTGSLRRGIISDAPTLVGPAAVGRTYPSVVYSRIQELGGRGLPARPYVAPGTDESMAEIQRIAEEEWAKSTRL